MHACTSWILSVCTGLFECMAINTEVSSAKRWWIAVWLYSLQCFLVLSLHTLLFLYLSHTQLVHWVVANQLREHGPLSRNKWHIWVIILTKAESKQTICSHHLMMQWFWLEVLHVHVHVHVCTFFCPSSSPSKITRVGRVRNKDFLFIVKTNKQTKIQMNAEITRIVVNKTSDWFFNKHTHIHTHTNTLTVPKLGLLYNGITSNRHFFQSITSSNTLKEAGKVWVKQTSCSKTNWFFTVTPTHPLCLTI